MNFQFCMILSWESVNLLVLSCDGSKWWPGFRFTRPSVIASWFIRIELIDNSEMSWYNDERWTFDNFRQCFTESLVPQAIFPNSETSTAIIILVTDPFDLMLLEGSRKSGSRSVLIWHVDAQYKMNADLKALLVLKSNTEGHTFLMVCWSFHTDCRIVRIKTTTWFWSHLVYIIPPTWLHHPTRKHSSRMYTVRLSTICTSVATRCQYHGERGFLKWTSLNMSQGMVTRCH